MENNPYVELYNKKNEAWKAEKEKKIRYHHYEEAIEQIHRNEFIIFGGKFQSLEFYFLMIMGVVFLSAFTLLGIFGYDEALGDPGNIIILVTGLLCSLIFIITALWYAFTVPKFALVLGPEGFLYKRQGIFRFFNWNEIEDIRAFDRYVRKRPNLRKKILIIKTEEFQKPVINMAKLPNLNIYLYYSGEFQLQETGRDEKAVEMQNIIEKLLMEYWNSRRN